jgi:regulator of replication initiation timing
VDLEPIDRLEEKVKLLVDLLNRLRAEQARTVEDNQRLAREIEALRARQAESEAVAAEVGSLREERDEIRTRVSEMLEQLETLNL